MATWEQLTCPTCGSNAVEMVNGFLCCKACKSKHTLEEKISEEEVIAFNNATNDRLMQNFGRALKEYELILKKSPNNETANWGALLSFYGIKYEYDKKTGTYIPTCHRLKEKPVISTPYYAKLNAEHKAKAYEIERLRLAIIDKAKKIQPYDVFICYKATEDRFGMPVPTKEASWARDVYEMLTHDLKLRVFFAEKSLVGSNIEYEPHIYSALNSAKLMFVMTTGRENVNSPWVKNEWERFAQYIAEGQKKTIRVVYDNMQPYDLPEELQATQAISVQSLDWGKSVKKAAEEIFGTPKKEEPKNQGNYSINIPAPSAPVDKYCVKCGRGNAIANLYCMDCRGNVFAPKYLQYCFQCGTETKLLEHYCPKCGNNTFVYTKEAYTQEVERRRLKAERAKQQRIAEENRKKKEAQTANIFFWIIQILYVIGTFIMALQVRWLIGVTPAAWIMIGVDVISFIPMFFVFPKIEDGTSVGVGLIISRIASLVIFGFSTNFGEFRTYIGLGIAVVYLLYGIWEGIKALWNLCCCCKKK